MSPVRITSTISALAPHDRAVLLERDSAAREREVADRVSAILARVRRHGDAALLELAAEFDGVRLPALEVPRTAWDAALDRIDATLRRALERARDNIEHVHRTVPLATTSPQLETESEPGITVGRRCDPLARVGAYAPGGRAAYPSSVLMAVVPARVAGVEEIIVCSPPDRSGLPSAVVLAAAALAGADRVFALGGAGAIAAMAYGTASVPRVDRIVGPGNAYVTEAKIQVAGTVATDAPAGPSELLVIADSTADPELVAREMLAQAEHDPLAAVVAVVLGEALRNEVVRALATALPAQARPAVMARALASRGAVLSAASLDEAIDFATAYAPEHLLLAVEDPRRAFERVRNAGSVFLGAASSVAFGDYMTGANHVLPTAALARGLSGLSVLDFVRWTTYQRVTPEAAARLAADVATIADAEGLPAHAAAARAWHREATA